MLLVPFFWHDAHIGTFWLVLYMEPHWKSSLDVANYHGSRLQMSDVNCQEAL